MLHKFVRIRKWVYIISKKKSNHDKAIRKIKNAVGNRLK